MRNGLLIGAVTGIGAIMAVACGSSSTPGDTTLPDVEAGTSGTSGASGLPGSSGTSGSSGEAGTSGGLDGGGEGGDGGGGIMPTTLKSGSVILAGVTSDGYAVYIAISGMTATLEVVPVAGGAATVLVPAFAQTDGVVVRGASVAYWTGVSTAGIGTLGYWTKATGAKAAVSTTSKSGMFYSSDDSSRIAFSVAATAVAAAPKSTDLAVTSATAAAAAPVITGNNAVNLAAAAAGASTPAACAPDIGFVGKILFAAYCTGTTAATTAGRLVSVPDASVTPARLDTASPTSTAAATVQPFWSADKTGTKVFVINSTNSKGRIIFNVASRTEATLENDTQDGLMLDDGTAVVYRVQNAAATTKAIRHATVVASPVIADLVATNAQGLLSVSLDQKHVLYNALAATTAGLVDINALGTALPPATVPLVATATAFPFGFTGDNTTVLYQTDVDATGMGKLKAQPVAGGTEKLLASAMFDARPLATGGRVIVLDNPKTDMTTMLTSVDLKLVDSATAAAPTLLADTVQADGFDVSGTHLVFTRFGAVGAGLYSIVLP
jgi:hypothetical protein